MAVLGSANSVCYSCSLGKVLVGRIRVDLRTNRIVIERSEIPERQEQFGNPGTVWYHQVELAKSSLLEDLPQACRPFVEWKEHTST